MHRELVFALLLFQATTVFSQIQDLTAASSRFSQNLYQEIAKPKNNVVYSPFSIHACFSMCSVGARGSTETEMFDVLGLDTLTSPHQTYRNLLNQMNSVTDVELNTANAVYVNPNFGIQSSFVNDVQTNYYASASNIDFSAPDGPEAPINEFVSDATKGLIPEIIPSGFITMDTAVVLVNTVFFNGTWAETFDEFATEENQTFTRQDGSMSRVDMMNDDRTLNIKRGAFFGCADVAELQFKGGQFSLYIVLPGNRHYIPIIEWGLKYFVNDFFTGLTSRRVRLAIPKFKIESEFDNLKGALQDIGMQLPFQAGNADFTGIIQTGNTYISDVVHKAVIEVMETGTVAAAATAIGISVTSVMLPPAEEFIADHPFLFFLRDNQNKHILFQGKFSGGD